MASGQRDNTPLKGQRRNPLPPIFNARQAMATRRNQTPEKSHSILMADPGGSAEPEKR